MSQGSLKKYFLQSAIVLIFLCAPLTDALGFYKRFQWPNNDRQNPVRYFINTSGAPAGFQQAVINAFNTWNAVSSADIAFIFSGTTSVKGPFQDGYLTISWSLTGGGLGGNLAVSSIWYDPQSKDILHADIVFNGTYQWSVTGNPLAYDIRTIALHEAGHFLGLGDLQNLTFRESIMENEFYVGEVFLNLYEDDIDGITTIYDGLSPNLEIRDGLGVPVPNNGITNQNSQTAYGQDSHSGMAQIALVQLPSGTTVQSQGYTGQISTVSVTFSSISDGQYAVRAFDQAGNMTSVDFTIDTTAPTETDSSVDENDTVDTTNPQLYFDFSEPIELVSLTIDGVDYTSNAYANGNRVNAHFTFTNGNHTIVLVVRDLAGNQTTVTRHFTVDEGTNDKLTIVGLGVSNIQRDSAKIKWQTYKGTTAVVTDGVVYYGTSHGNLNSSTMDSGNGSSHEVSLTGLNEGTDYFFKAASSGGGESAVSDTDTFKTLGPGQGYFTWSLSAKVAALARSVKGKRPTEQV